MEDEMKLAILEKMGEQLQGVIETIQYAKPPNMSAQTHAKTLSDMVAQREVLEWAHSCCKLAMEAGVSDAQTTH